MLILTRRIGESIAIGDHVAITLLAVQGRHAKIGITAPKDITVLRAELLQRSSPDAHTNTLQHTTPVNGDHAVAAPRYPRTESHLD